MAHKYLHGVTGTIVQILPLADKSIIEFKHGGVNCKAVMSNERFYHNGKRIIPPESNVTKYIKIGLKVKFSCHALDSAGANSMYYATVCWRDDEDSGYLPMKLGILHTKGEILKLSKRHGVITTDDNTLVYFIASKLYLFEKRMQSTKSLQHELSIDDKVFFDAIPCFPSENEEKCSWFATIVFKGKKPDLGEEKHDFSEYDFNKMNSHDLRTFINQYMSDSRKVYISGKGMFMKSLSDEFGVVMGELKKNVFQTVFFHRKSLFVLKLNMGNERIDNVLIEGDRLKFIAVEAPLNFVTDFIAVQVAIDIPDDFEFITHEIQGKEIL